MPMTRVLLKVWAKPDDLSVWPNYEMVDGVKPVGGRRIVISFEFHEALIVIQWNQSLQSRPVRLAGLFLCFSYGNVALPYIFSITQGDGVRTHIVHFVREQVGDFLKTALDGQFDILLCRSTRGRELSHGSGRWLPFGRPQFRWHDVLSGDRISSGQTKHCAKRQGAEVMAQFERAVSALS